MALAADSPVPDFSVERRLMRRGFRRVCGVDEAGRGPLAGPVVAAAVVLDPKRIPRGLADSKLLDRQEREAAFAAICASAEIAFALASAATIDRVNIRQATLAAMRRAICSLAVPADAALVDGRDIPASVPCETQAIIGGDASSVSIAAASIVAKVIRDRLMVRCDDSFAGYGLASHKGYSTRAHQSALNALGPCRLHRRSFAPVAAFFEKA